MPDAVDSFTCELSYKLSQIETLKALIKEAKET